MSVYQITTTENGKLRYLGIGIGALQTGAIADVPHAYLAVSCASSASKQTRLPRTPSYCLQAHTHSTHVNYISLRLAGDNITMNKELHQHHIPEYR